MNIGDPEEVIEIVPDKEPVSVPVEPVKEPEKVPV